MAAQLEYVEPARVVIDGASADAMHVCASAGRPLGQFRGVVVDPVDRRLRYLVVSASRMFNRLVLVPAAAARVDLAHGVIEVDASDSELHALRNFTLDELLALGTPGVA